MSVAFRRESDDEHLEPTFEIPIAPGPNLVTARGLRRIAATLAELDARIAAETDPAAITVLRRDQRYWATRRSTAQVVPTPGTDDVAIGSRVTFRIANRTRTIDIVGGDEADAATDRIAFAAPLARALIGTASGDLADFNGVPDAIAVLATGPAPDAD